MALKGLNSSLAVIKPTVIFTFHTIASAMHEKYLLS